MAYLFTVTTVLNEVNITPNAAQQFTITNITRNIVIGNPGSIVIGSGTTSTNNAFTGTIANLTVTNALYIGVENTFKIFETGTFPNIQLNFGEAGNTRPFLFTTPTANFSGAINLNGSTIETVGGYLVLTNTTGTVISNELAVTGTLTLDNSTIDSPSPVNFLSGIEVTELDIGGLVSKEFTIESSNPSTNSVISTFDGTQYGSAKYVVQIHEIASGKREVIEMMVMYDGTDIYVNEYGILANQGAFGDFDHQVVDGQVQTSYTWNFGDPPSFHIKIRVSATLLSN